MFNAISLDISKLHFTRFFDKLLYGVAHTLIDMSNEMNYFFDYGFKGNSFNVQRLTAVSAEVSNSRLLTGFTNRRMIALHHQ
jgi:hypothetical protein